MDAIALLKADHRRVSALFERYSRAGATGESKRMIAESILDELRLHSQLEEESFYALLGQAQSESVKGLVRHATEEHSIVDRLVSELGMIDPEDGRYDAKMKVLRETVERHVAEEQSLIFPQARRWLGEPRLIDLGREMAATQRAHRRGVSEQVSTAASRVTRQIGEVAAAAVRGVRRGLKSGGATGAPRRSRPVARPRKTTSRRAR